MKADIPISAIVRPDNGVRQLTSSAEPAEEVTDDRLAQSGYTVRLFMRILRDLASLKRRWAPRRIDFEDRAVPAGDYVRFTHGLGGRVRWWPVDTTGNVPALIRSTLATNLSDDNTLVLFSATSCTLTLRIEEAG